MIHIPPHGAQRLSEDSFSPGRLCAVLFLFAALGWVVIDVHTALRVL